MVTWDQLTWASGSRSNSFDVDPLTAGNDVTVTVSGSKTVFTNDIHTGTLTPQIDSSLAGGMSPVHNSLDLAANLHTNSRVTFSLDFSGYAMGVSNVSFTIFDIDLGTNHDQIKNIYGIALDGTHVAATISNVGSAVSLTGTGLSQVLQGNVAVADSGATSGDGNATISFGTVITGLVFTFANDAGAPRYQQIGIGDIFFIPVPELSASVASTTLCVIALLLLEWRRHVARRRRSMR
jgi:hypothetical protein